MNEALSGVSRDFSDLGVAVGRAEEKIRRMLADASAVSALIDSGALHPLAEDEVLVEPELHDSLLRGFRRLESEEGLKALRQLDYEYGQVQRLLRGREKTNSLSVAQIPPLAEETYRQGLSVLKDALGLHLSIHSPDRERLEEELAELDMEINILKEDEGEEARVRMKEETLASHRERLILINQQRSHVEELLHQCGRCEASLHRTRIELAELKAPRSA